MQAIADDSINQKQFFLFYHVICLYQSFDFLTFMAIFEYQNQFYASSIHILSKICCERLYFF